MTPIMANVVMVMVATLAQVEMCACAFHYKMLSGEVSEFPQHKVPNTVNAAVMGDHTVFVVDFNGPSWSHTLDVDASKGFAFALFACMT